METQPTYDLYWSFRSPYSYLALPRVQALATEKNIHCQVRIVYPLAVRYPEHFRRQRENPQARPYFLADCERVADFLGMPFRRPVPDPIVQDPVTLEVAKEQPHIFGLSRMGIAAGRRGRALPFITEVSRVLWDGSVDGWNEGDHLAQAARRAGLDLAELRQAVAEDPEGHDAEIQANQQAQHAAGHWGVPLFVYGGQPFFGQDRFDHLVWHIERDLGAGRPDPGAKAVPAREPAG